MVKETKDIMEDLMGKEIKDLMGALIIKEIKGLMVASMEASIMVKVDSMVDIIPITMLQVI